MARWFATLLLCSAQAGSTSGRFGPSGRPAVSLPPEQEVVRQEQEIVQQDRNSFLPGCATPRGPLVLIAAGIVALTLFCALDHAVRLAQTSDSVQGFLAGHAVLLGNSLLAGWNLPVDNYYFTDIIPYAAIEWLIGPNPKLLVLVPAVTYAILVSVVLALSLKRSRSFAQNLVVMGTVILTLAAPAWIGIWNPLLMSNMHFATVVAALIALALCAGIIRSNTTRPRTRRTQNALLFLLVSAIVASDPFSLVFAFGPAIALLSFDVIIRSDTRGERSAALIVAGAAGFGLLLPHLVEQAGGFTTDDNVTTTFVAGKFLLRNVVALLFNVLRLFGVSPFATDHSLAERGAFPLHTIALAIVVVAVSRVLLRLYGRNRAALLDRLLAICVLSGLAACAVSTQFGKGINPQNVWAGGPPMRYAMPAVLLATLLAARQVSEMLATFKARQTAVLAATSLASLASLTVFANLSTIDEHSLWIKENPPVAAVQWLSRHGLTEGRGEYWSANLITAMSGDTVHVRSVVVDGGKLTPYVLSASWKWFEQPPQFVVWQNGNQTGVTSAHVYATYPICRTTTIGGYRIATGAGEICATAERAWAWRASPLSRTSPSPRHCRCRPPS